MMDRLILAVMMGMTGWNNLHPEPPKPPTSAELRYKAKQKSVSNLCQKPRKTKTVRELCSKWEK